MGYYINPQDQTKEQFLHVNGVIVAQGAFLEAASQIKDENSLIPVCHVDNNLFTAAGIAYSPQEAEEFATPCGRPKTYYLVPYVKIMELGEKGNGGYKIR